MLMMMRGGDREFGVCSIVYIEGSLGGAELRNDVRTLELPTEYDLQGAGARAPKTTNRERLDYRISLVIETTSRYIGLSGGCTVHLLPANCRQNIMPKLSLILC